MLKRILSFILVSFMTLAVLFLALEVFAHINPPKTLRTYYRLEYKWDGSWPLGHELLLNLEPAMFRLGVLRPARVEIERGLTLYLDPRDLVPSTFCAQANGSPRSGMRFLPHCRKTASSLMSARTSDTTQ